MRLFKGISAIAFSIFALASFNAEAETVVIASGTCYSYGCSTPAQNCGSQGGTFSVNSANGQYTCTKTYPDAPSSSSASSASSASSSSSSSTPQTWVVIASGTCYSYGCQTAYQYCSSQGGAFSVNGSNQYTCKKLM